MLTSLRMRNPIRLTRLFITLARFTRDLTLLDEVFDESRFRNEIVSWYYNKLQGNIRRFPSNHETIFFRSGPHLRALREVLLLEIHRRKPAGEPIRIWSAGCATGEEPFSLAITVLETLGQPLARPVEIWATDLSEPALRKAPRP